MSAYDCWLEKPYNDAAVNEAAFEKFCEENNLDYDDEDSWSAFEKFLEDETEVE